MHIISPCLLAYPSIVYSIVSMFWKILDDKFLQNFYDITYYLANQSHKGHSFKMQDMQCLSYAWEKIRWNISIPLKAQKNRMAFEVEIIFCRFNISFFPECNQFNVNFIIYLIISRKFCNYGLSFYHEKSLQTPIIKSFCI